MTDPEIARRCSVCGATIRKRSMFCPQCGQKVAAETETTESEPSVKTAKAKAKSSKAKRDTRDTQIELSDPTKYAAPETVPLKPIAPVVESPPIEAPVAAATTVEVPPPAEVAPTQALTPVNPVKPVQKRRAASETQPLTAVGKLRKVSTVVIDQAGYDPSVRFLLVAGVLFILFLVLLLMSKWVG